MTTIYAIGADGVALHFDLDNLTPRQMEDQRSSSLLHHDPMAYPEVHAQAHNLTTKKFGNCFVIGSFGGVWPMIPAVEYRYGLHRHRSFGSAALR